MSSFLFLILNVNLENCFFLNRVLKHGQENETTVQSIVQTVAPSLMYTVDTDRRDSKWLSNCEAVSLSTASDILSFFLVEYEHIFVQTSTQLASLCNMNVM